MGEKHSLLLTLETDGKKISVPIHIRDLDMSFEGEDVGQIHIFAISFEKTELETWGQIASEIFGKEPIEEKD